MNRSRSSSRASRLGAVRGVAHGIAGGGRQLAQDGSLGQEGGDLRRLAAQHVAGQVVE